MKILVVSDIHANWPALQAVLAAERKVDGVVCLGDLVNYGPRPAECVSWAQANVDPGWIVQGNHDRALGCDEDPRCSTPYRHLAAVMQRHNAERLDAEAKEYLAALVPVQTNQLGNARCLLCHAMPSEPLYGYLERQAPRDRWEAEIRMAGRPDFLLLGHTHIPFARLLGSTMIVNPGSVGQPKGGDPRAAYALLQDGEVILKRAAYDVEAVAMDLSDCAPPAIGRALANVLRTGGTLPAEDGLACSQ